MKKLAIAALLLLACAGVNASSLPFIEDDFTKAVARARANNVPIFVESWAPW